MTKQLIRTAVICAVMKSILTVWTGMKPMTKKVCGWSAARRSQEIMHEATYVPMIDPRPYGRIG